MSCEKLHKAKKIKNDEFYTRLEDIEAEILGRKEYIEQLENKIIYMNCDHPDNSNFWKFFKEHFEGLKLKKIVCTHYIENGQAFKTEYDGIEEKRTDLIGDGDFRSDECIEILKNSDVVITNPPFSLWRELLEVIIKNDKLFLILGALVSAKYRIFFNLIKAQKAMVGFNAATKFNTPEEEKEVFTRWYTNIPKDKNKEGLFTKPKLEKYDDYDYLNANRLSDVPDDYYEPIGVPITYLSKHNHKQFKIIELISPHINNKKLFDRVVIQRIKPDEEEQTSEEATDGKRKTI